ncbi:MAG TPA: hypothetical protein VK879_16125 [Candidatus Sulfomarinibacteraceae bacterium]|nr:hypothetical protein [Candidatus Sulfomarinibacteraceae bacterium]
MSDTRSDSRRKTAWMWLDNDQLRGLFLDVEAERLTWVWQAGCHCADEDEIVQSVETFYREGPPALMGSVPEDVVAQIRAAAKG